MRKVITYPIFVIAFVLVALLFVTSKDFTQLGLAVVLYPLLAYLALNLFPRRLHKDREVTIQPLVSITPKVEVLDNTNDAKDATTEEKKDSGGIADIDKRAFLKLIGAAGISVFLFSLFSKRAQVPFFGKVGTADSVNLKDSKGKTIDPAQNQPFDGFQISEIDDGIVAYYGFINQTGGWFIMREDAETSSFRYAKGDSNFPHSWNNRAKISYDYYHNL